MPITTMSNEPKRQTLFITVIASAIGSVAFGVSIFAMGLLWLIPSVRPASPDLPVRPKLKDKSRRRSAPPILQCSEPKITSILETDTASSFPPHPSHSSPRRVYFLDSQIRPSNKRRYSELSNLPSQVGNTSTFILVQQDDPDPEVSPRSSSSTLVHVIEAPLSPSPPLETCQESIESDSASSSASHPGSSSPTRPSHSLATHLSGKVKSRLKKASHSQSGRDSGGETNQPNHSTRSKPARSSSLGFSPPWISSKKRAQTIDLASPSTSPTASRSSPPPESNTINSSPSSSSSMLPHLPRSSSSNSRRPTSMPARPLRTNPYSFPYFAEPPKAAQNDKDHPSSLTSSEETMINDKPSIQIDDRTLEEHRIVNERKQRNAEVQASLGHGRRPPQRRAASDVLPVHS